MRSARQEAVSGAEGVWWVARTVAGEVDLRPLAVVLVLAREGAHGTELAHHVGHAAEHTKHHTKRHPQTGDVSGCLPAYLAVAGEAMVVRLTCRSWRAWA